MTIPLSAAQIQAYVAQDGFRLPTSDEWEYARAAGARTLWRWGDEIPMILVPSRYAYVEGNPVVFTDPSGHRFAACDAENPGSPCSTGGVGGGDPSGTGGIGDGNGNGDGTDRSFTPPSPPGIPAGDVPPIEGGAGFENFDELPVGMPETIQEPDGTTETVTNEGGGNVEIEFSDGVTVQEHADGSSETIEPDGEVIEQTGDVATEQDAVEAPKPTEPEENNSTNNGNGNTENQNNRDTNPKDLYRNGNSNSPRLDNVRVGKDVELDENGMIDPNKPLSNGKAPGISTTDEPQVGKYWWRLPANSDMPEGLRWLNDEPGHWALQPSRIMSLEEYLELLRMFWEYSGHWFQTWLP